MLLLIKQWMCGNIFGHPALKVSRVDKNETVKEKMVFSCTCMNCDKFFLTDYEGFERLYKKHELK